MFGSLMGPTAEAQPADLESQWNATLKDPKIQAMLLAAGQQLMMPRWTAGSALPDAMGAAGRTASGIEQQEYARTVAEQKRQDQLNDSQEDRASRERIATQTNDTRALNAEVAANSRLEGIRLRQELSGGPKDRQEDKIYNDALHAARTEFRKRRENAWLTREQIHPDTEDEQRAAQKANEALTLYRAQRAGGGVAGPFTSANPAGGTPPQGMSQPSGAGKIISTNPQNVGAPSAAPTLKTTREALDKLKQDGVLDKILKDPKAYDRLKDKVSDPQSLKHFLDLMQAGR